MLRTDGPVDKSVARRKASHATPAIDEADDSNKGTIQRAAAILRALEGEAWGMSLSAISAATGTPRSTVHRLIKTLMAEHLVATASEAGGYRLGPAFFRIAASFNSWLAAWMRPELLRLSQAVGETVDLAFLVGRQMIFVDQVAVPHRLQAISGVGLQLPLHCTASGKALLSALPDDEVLRTVDLPLARFTANTIVDKPSLLVAIDECRSSCLAFDREEHHIGVSGLATSLSGPLGGLAAIGIPVPTARLVGREQELSRALLQSRKRMTALIAQRTS